MKLLNNDSGRIATAIEILRSVYLKLKYKELWPENPDAVVPGFIAAIMWIGVFVIVLVMCTIDIAGGL